MTMQVAKTGIVARTALSLSDRWFQFRNDILSNPRFQRWAARFPLTRMIARKRAAALFDLCAGFVYSQVLYATVRLGLLEALTLGPLTVDELAPKLSLSLAATRRLLDAAASLKLVERRGPERYGLGVHGASFIGNPAVAVMVEHHALVYRDLSDPIGLLRGKRDTELSAFWSYSHGSSPVSESDVAEYSLLMARTVSLVAEDVIEAYPLERHRRLLDIGGGEGAFLQAVAERTPHLALSLFDLPPVAARARHRLDQNSTTSSRAAVIGGDVFRDALPTNADVVSLVRVIHDHDDREALQIMRAARRALVGGGCLLLAEPMANTSGAEPMGEAYFGFYLLAMGQGRPRTPDRLRTMLLEAGFDHVHRRATRRPMLAQLLVAEAYS
jgi:demethylspheroidene O-methyltransferase